jgi:diguanylate cyclase (GGDEF)-like protein
MDGLSIPWAFRLDLWVAAAVMAVGASFVGLEVARGIESTRRSTSVRSLLAAALALACGVWSGHLIVMAGEPLPFRLGYQGAVAFAALVLTYVCVAAGLSVGVGCKSPLLRFGAAPLVLGLGACAGPMLLLAALHVSPALHWGAPSLGIALAWSTLLSAGAFWALSRRQRHTPWAHARAWHALATSLLAGAVLGADALVLSAAEVPVGALSYTAGRVASETLTALATVGVPTMLGLLLLGSILEAHFKALLQRSREELRLAAQTDPLTGLPNRAMFEEMLQAAVPKADRQAHRLALLFVNLDGMKAVNESFGQAAGDMVLREIGNRLSELGGERVTVARAGGDEFLLLQAGNPATADASQLATRVLSKFTVPCKLDEHEVAVQCSIGIAMYPEHGAMSKLIAHADAAMQAAKRTGGATYCFFEARMVSGAREQIELLHDLRRAIENEELELYYQPKIHAPSGQITGAEALMRWHHPTRGMVSPGVFIPLAERFGLINAMGNWLIDDVCRQIRAWREQGLRMRVAINLSVHQLRQPDMVQRIADALKRHRIEPSLLTCEITESAAMDDMRVTLQVLEQLRTLGVRLAIDDFGTGYSSLSYLRQLAVEELKIDRSFVMDLETNVDARAIVDAVVKLAQALGLKVVAEGVETVKQQEILRSLGCDELQGFLFAKPMSARALALWAMKDEAGPTALDFRPSLFGDTLPAHVD